MAAALVSAQVSVAEDFTGDTGHSLGAGCDHHRRAMAHSTDNGANRRLTVLRRAGQDRGGVA
ncbi:hypothetical protein ARTHRO9V_160148 [Arthrobacter sp. 9V]|nr:hypothetical protein ARTHRO9V_160148 [Arthrobacter sp. 9V]